MELMTPGDTQHVRPDVNVGLLRAVMDGHVDTVRKIIAEADTSAIFSPTEEDPLLLIALKAGHDDIVKLLVEVDGGRGVSQYDSNGKVVLHYLACTSKVDLMRTVIAAGGDVNVRDSEEKTPLHYAAAMNQQDSTRLLLEIGALPDLAEQHLMTPLTISAKHGSTSVAELLIAHGADVNHRDGTYYTPLHHACRGAHLSTVNLLLSSGAVLSQANTGESELMLATEVNAFGIVKCLIVNHADANLVNRKKMCTLHYAAKVGCVVIANLLLCTPDIQLNVQDRKGFTPLMVAARHGQHEVLGILIGAGAHVTIQDNQLLTCLHHAALCGHVTCIMTLLRSGARVETTGENGNPPLLLAACNGHAEAVKLLLNASKGNQYLNVNNANHDHMTALHMAADRGHTQCAELLLQDGADPGRPNRNGNTPLMVAARRGNDLMVRAILSHLTSQADSGHCLNKVNLTKRSALHAATKAGANECVQLMLLAGALPDLYDVHGKTALILAAELGHEVITEHLINAGCDVTVRTDEGWTALHVAAQNNCVAVAELLLGASLSPDLAVWTNGITPILLTAARGHCGVLKLLLRRGADANQADFSGMTALHKAARGGHALCMWHLLMSGARIDPESTSGLTPAMVAVAEGHRGALRVLLEFNCQVARLDLLTTKPNKKFATIVEMLLMAGCRVNIQAINELLGSGMLPVPLVENPSLLAHLTEFSCNPLSLRQRCRCVLRECISYGIAKKVAELPLPVFLQNFILMKDLRQIIIVDPD